jgi:hypothetical protein
MTIPTVPQTAPSRHITITKGGWIDSIKSKKRRGDVMRMIFSLAASEGYEIRVAGEKWHGRYPGA